MASQAEERVDTAMGPNITRTASIEARLGRMNQRLVVHAEAVDAESINESDLDENNGNFSEHNNDENSEIYRAPMTPAEDVLTQLEREHRINRIINTELVKLRLRLTAYERAAHFFPVDDPALPASDSDEYLNIRQKLLLRTAENDELFDHVQELLTLLEKKDRQFTELENQLRVVSAELNAAMADRKSKGENTDSDPSLSSANNPVAETFRLIDGMSHMQLSEVSTKAHQALCRARAEALAEARAEARGETLAEALASSPTSSSDYEEPGMATRRRIANPPPGPLLPRSAGFVRVSHFTRGKLFGFSRLIASADQLTELVPSWCRRRTGEHRRSSS